MVIETTITSMKALTRYVARQLYARRQCRECHGDISPALTASGNALDNVITSNSSNDVLFGGTGNDTLKGAGAGDDVRQGDDGNDIFDGQGDTNWITIRAGQVTLIFNFKQRQPFRSTTSPTAAT